MKGHDRSLSVCVFCGSFGPVVDTKEPSEPALHWILKCGPVFCRLPEDCAVAIMRNPTSLLAVASHFRISAAKRKPALVQVKAVRGSFSPTKSWCFLASCYI